MTRRGRKRGGAPRRVRPRRETSAGGVVMRQENGEPVFLLIRDSYGHWGFPKGHLERGEPSERAAVREVGEETGLTDVRVLASIATIEWRFRFRGRVVQKRCEFFLMESASADTRPQKSEGITACTWAPMSDALEMIAYDNARAVLRQADALVANRSLRSA